MKIWLSNLFDYPNSLRSRPVWIIGVQLYFVLLCIPILNYYNFMCNLTVHEPVHHFCLDSLICSRLCISCPFSTCCSYSRLSWEWYHQIPPDCSINTLVGNMLLVIYTTHHTINFNNISLLWSYSLASHVHNVDQCWKKTQMLHLCQSKKFNLFLKIWKPT